MGKIISAVSVWAGSINAVAIATLLIIIYILGGCCVGFSDTYNMIANTIMSAASFIMLFILQYSQLRDTKALHLKLDEVILKMTTADNKMLAAELLNDAELEELATHYGKIAEKCRLKQNGSQ